MDLNTEEANMYPCQALPGSSLYNLAKKSTSSPLPVNYEGYAFLSYESQPMATKYCSAAEVISFRDEAWTRYHSSPKYLSLVESRFGLKQRQNVESMAQIRLCRKILGDPPPER